MVLEKYIGLDNYLPQDCAIPAAFFLNDQEDTPSCIFLVSCLSADRILYIDDTCREITGYSPEHFIKRGMDFWFPLIHPEDMSLFTEKIISAHREILAPGFNKDDHSPLVFEYRFRNPAGEYVKIRDTKFMLFPGNEITVDMILCKFELIEETRPGITAVEDILRTEKSCSKMLEFALVHQNSQQRHSIDEEGIHPATEGFNELPLLTRREKEVLLMIGEGLSTKMIAERCFISINTVETHRRHLLEKLDVRNSMELIKKASKFFWL